MTGVLIMTAVLISTFGALWVATLPETSKKERNTVVVTASTISALIVWGLLIYILKTGNTLSVSARIASLRWKFSLDPLGMVYAVIVSSLWVFTAVYSLGYMEQDQNQRRYFIFFLLSAGVTLGIAFSGNLFTLYLFYELLTFCTYPLMIHEGSEEALRQGNRYLKYSLAEAVLILAALVMLAKYTGGNLDFGTQSILAGTEPSGALTFLLFLFLAGFGVKAAVMPLHGWLTSAMAVPTPVSALLLEVAVVNAGVFGILRTVYSVFGSELLDAMEVRWILLLIASITILCGSLFAMQQDVLKKRLAYSTISQLSYILLGAFTLHPWGLAGAVLHMIFHAGLKITLFFSAGIVMETTGYVRVSQLKGVGKELPLTMGSFGIASLGLIGMLPLSGYWSKYYLMQGSIKSGHWPLLLVLLISALLNAFYYLPITVSAFTGGDGVEPVKKSRGLFFMLVPTLILAGIALVFGLWPGLTLPIVDAVVQQFFIS